MAEGERAIGSTILTALTGVLKIPPHFPVLNPSLPLTPDTTRRAI